MNIYPIEGNIKTGEIDWIKSGQSYDNYRLVSGTLQATQLLCTVANQYGYRCEYKPYAINHPNRLWVSESRSNFSSIISLTNVLFDEYRIRFGKVHKCQSICKDLQANYKRFPFPKEESTQYNPAVPLKFYHDNPIISARMHWLSKDKMKYPKNKIPQWFLEHRKINYEITL